MFPRSQPSRAALFALAATMLGACGGGGSDLGPLRHRVDDKYLAPIATSERGAYLDAKSRLDEGQLEEQKARYDLERVGENIQRAENSRSQAELEVKNAESKLGSAKKAANTQDIADAERELEKARALLESRDALVRAWSAENESLQKRVDATTAELRAREARMELEKARLARDNRISPEGFAFENFSRQLDERIAAAQRVRAEADNVRLKTEARWNEFREKENRSVDAGNPGAEPVPNQRS